MVLLEANMSWSMERNAFYRNTATARKNYSGNLQNEWGKISPTAITKIKKKRISSIVPLTPLFSCLSSIDNTPTEARGQGKAGGCSSQRLTPRNKERQMIDIGFGGGGWVPNRKQSAQKMLLNSIYLMSKSIFPKHLDLE